MFPPTFDYVQFVWYVGTVIEGLTTVIEGLTAVIEGSTAVITI